MEYEKACAGPYRIRRVDEEIARIFSIDKIKSPVRPSVGQEAVSVGVFRL